MCYLECYVEIYPLCLLVISCNFLFVSTLLHFSTVDSTKGNNIWTQYFSAVRFLRRAFFLMLFFFFLAQHSFLFSSSTACLNTRTDVQLCSKCNRVINSRVNYKYRRFIFSTFYPMGFPKYGGIDHIGIMIIFIVTLLTQ